jgi:carbamoyltransferase
MTSLALGLSFGFHDASAAIVSSEGVIAFAAEERLSRQKHDASFPRMAIEECLKAAGIRFEDISHIAYHERPEPAFTRVLTSALAGFPHSAREFSASMRAWLSGKLWVRGQIAARLATRNTIELFSHHDCHAAQSYLTSGYTDAAILTLDAIGEWTSTGIFHGQGSAVHALKAVKFPHSLGLFYSAMTAYLGFTPMDGECSTMALAAFGKPRYVDLMRKIVKLTSEGYTVDQSYFRFVAFYQKPFSEKLIAALGAPRSQFEDLSFSSWEETTASANEQRFADIAASVQLVFEEAVLHLARIARRLSGSSRLCLAGGGAMNSVAVKALQDSGLYQDIYLPPDPGDGGAAAGAALLCLVKNGLTLQDATWKPWSGLAANREGLGFLEHLRPEHAQRFSKVGFKQEPFVLEEREVGDDDDLAAEVAKLIAERCIVGWCQGRFESGPRALGARSILIRPDDVDLAKRLSSCVKARAAFRPYALSILDSDAPKVLTRYDAALRPYHWMQIVDHVRPEYRKALKAGLHIDQTTRPQVVFADQVPRYHRLLKAVRHELGLGVLINTSFNESGYPIVHTSQEALAVFLRSGMDALVLGSVIYRKVKSNKRDEP